MFNDNEDAGAGATATGIKCYRQENSNALGGRHGFPSPMDLQVQCLASRHGLSSAIARQVSSLRFGERGHD